ncbi:MAG: zinc-binding dehydrogenase, partial [Actinobacteria bacterium]|nr:zinc-binding dehydrogenase [Actinomycetota bacterium]
VDLALDSIAGPQFAPTVDCVADSGRVVVFGMGAGVPGSVTTDVLHPRNRSVVGYSTGSLARREPDRLRPAGDAVLRLFAERRIRVMIGRTYPLEDARRAHRDIEGGLSTGKLLLRTGLEPERATEVGPTSERGT